VVSACRVTLYASGRAVCGYLLLSHWVNFAYVVVGSIGSFGIPSKCQCQREREERVESGYSSCCLTLHHSPANRLNVKIGPKVEAPVVSSPASPTSSPLARRIHQNPTDSALSIVFPLLSQHWLQILSRIKTGIIRPHLDQRATGNDSATRPLQRSASTIHSRRVSPGAKTATHQHWPLLGQRQHR
jgi:hypothetical protein